MAVNADVQVYEIEQDENQPLIRHNTRSHQAAQEKSFKYIHFPYRLFNISEKGAIFMITINVFFMIVVFSCFGSTADIKIRSINLQFILLWIPGGLVILLCPIVALLSDCYFGRYKILQTSIYCLLVAIVLMALSTITMSSSIWYVTLVPISMTAACYVPCIIPFTIDQLVGASGEELSFTIYWILWASITCACTQNFFHCFLPKNQQLQQAIMFGVAALSFAIMFTMTQCCSHVLMTKPQISNPVKLVARVLNYARKNKFPERRSAFTYWEEECPSRIDLGKSKYGGPFTVEEVEDVKTVLKLILLLISIIPVIALGTTRSMEFMKNYCIISDFRFWINFVCYLLVISCLPIYQFLIYPFLYNRIPSMLRRIGCGMFLIVFSHVLNAVVKVYVVTLSHDDVTTTNCNYSAYESVGFSVSSWLKLASDLINRVGLLIAALSSFEFFIAQSPCHFRAFVTSIFMELWAISALLSLIVFDSIPDHYIAYIAISVVMLVIFILFVFVSKWYKLRKRNDVIPYHMFAEDQFESDYRQEIDYLQKHGWIL